MKLNRVFVSGVGILSAFGKSWAEMKLGFERGENAVQIMENWRGVKDLDCLLAAPLQNYTPPKEWNRKQLRSLGLLGQYSVEAAGLALKNADLLNDKWELKDGFKEKIGVASGSCIGSTPDILDLAKLFLLNENTTNANTYIRFMPHTSPANIALFYGLQGRMIPSSSACTSASLAIGYSYEAIKFNRAQMMLCGGAEELCASEAFVFNSLYATSLKNSTPKLTPRPFDENRDGLVIGEGAGFLLLESEESLKERGGVAIAEVVGFGSSTDGTHITRPNPPTMRRAMELALEDANLKPNQIGHINAHATATKWGDIAESIASFELFGSFVPVSSLKGYLGHTLGACGALESIASIFMMKDKKFYPNLNLEKIDPECASLDYMQEAREIDCEFVMNNNFAFGGVNTSLIFKKI